MKVLHFYNPVKILSGYKSLDILPQVMPGTETCLLVTSPGMVRRGTAQKYIQSTPGREWLVYEAAPNPELDVLDDAIQFYRDAHRHISAILALGGGSSIDTSKAFSYGLAAEAARPLQQSLRHRQPERTQAIPLICIPTSAGTGAEVTPFATIWDKASQKKYSLASEQVFPLAAILDPQTTLSLPWTETLYSAMDALSHSLETLWNKTATEYTFALAERAIKLICTHLPIVENNPSDIQSRTALQNAACIAGMAISQNHTSLAHAMSYPLTLSYNVPHGLACSAFLLSIIKFISQKESAISQYFSNIFAEACTLLERYNMRSQLEKYCSSAELNDLIEMMFHADRINTFVFPVTKKDMHYIILE